jgi:hypothetical protein
MSRPLDGYPTSFGSSRASVMGVAGPTSYTQLVPGTAPAVATGGQTIRATDFGLKYFDHVVAGLTDTGIHRVECIPGDRSGSGPKGACLTYTLRWVVVASGAELAGLQDVHTEIVRVRALGPK